jgi:HEAT repeat protein
MRMKNRLPCAILATLCCCPFVASAASEQIPGVIGGTKAPEVPNEFANTNYDEVVRDLLTNLDKSPASAADSAVKLGGLGKRAVPALVDTITTYYGKMKDDAKAKNNPRAAINEQVVLYAAIALARIKSADAGKALLPMLTDTKANPNIRYTCVTANGLEYSDDAVAALQKIAAGDPDIDMRRKAYNRLTAMPKQWMGTQKLFIGALNDEDLEIRTIAAKQFYFAAPVYRDSIGELVAFVEKEKAEAPRVQAILAVGRMRAGEAIPALMRLYSADDATPGIQKVCLRSINDIASMNFKDGPSLQTWWAKFGEKQYSKMEEVLLKKKVPDAADKVEKDDTAKANDTQDAKAPSVPQPQPQPEILAKPSSETPATDSNPVDERRVNTHRAAERAAEQSGRPTK